MVSREEVKELHEADKIIEEDWQWDVQGPNVEGEATVYCRNRDETLTLRAWKRRSYGFCLLYKGATAIRRWDDGVHRKPNGECLEGSHKHYWTPIHEDQKAYEVDDIATDDVDQAFHDFLEEENIDLLGNYTRQTELNES